ncbi:hypothetical protein IGI04_036749, partial [Brassica rapa subsp. trilocularis]
MQGSDVSQRMKSVHAERHVDVGVSLYMRVRHESRHVGARVSPHMQPEACGPTHSHSYGHFSLACHLYKYPATFHNFHSSHSREREREREKESGQLRVQSSFENRYFTEKASFLQSMIFCDSYAKSLPKSARPSQYIEVLKLDTPPGIPKNCPTTREGSTRVQFSPEQRQGWVLAKSSPINHLLIGIEH